MVFCLSKINYQENMVVSEQAKRKFKRENKTADFQNNINSTAKINHTKKSKS